MVSVNALERCESATYLGVGYGAHTADQLVQNVWVVLFPTYTRAPQTRRSPHIRQSRIAKGGCRWPARAIQTRVQRHGAPRRAQHR
jgi:hypothetical protein